MDLDDVVAAAGLVTVSAEVEAKELGLDVDARMYMGWPIAEDQSYRHPAHEEADRRRMAKGAPRSFYVQGSPLMRTQEVGWVPWVGARPIFESTEPGAWVQDLWRPATPRGLRP